MNKDMKQATADVVGDNSDKLLKQIDAAVQTLRAEMRMSSGEAHRNALLALEQTKKHKDLRKKLRGKKELTPEEAMQLLKAANDTQKLLAELAETNGAIKGYGGKKGLGADGMTMTERMRKEQKDLSTKEEIIKLLQDINERREELNEAKQKDSALKDTMRKSLAAFLGPAGPLVETFFDLKKEYGEDAKKITGKITKWLGLERNVLKEIEKEAERSQQRDKKLFGMMSDKFRKFAGLLGGGGGLLDMLGDWWDRRTGGKGGRGGRRGPRGGAAKKGWFGRTGQKVAGWFGKGGAVRGALGAAGRFGLRALGPIGTILGGADLIQNSTDAGRDPSNKGYGDYATGAFRGALAGSFAGPPGMAIGAAIGLVFTGVVRNWTSFKEGIADGWKGVTNVAGNAYDSMVGYGRSAMGFYDNMVTRIQDGFGKTVQWMRDNVPGFNKLMAAGSAIKEGASQVVNSGMKAVSAGGAAVANVVSGAAKGAMTAASLAGAEIKSVATDATIGATNAVTAGANKVAEGAANIAKKEEGTALGGAAAVVGQKAKGVARMSQGIGGRAALEREMDAAGITDPKERAMMLAQVDHESGFRSRSENLNYSSVERIKTVFGKNKGIAGMSDEEIKKLVNNPEALANVVYADKNRSKNSQMGNTAEGDGYLYRGRGMIQLTGKANYEKYGKMLGIDLVSNPDLANDPDIAARLATAYWKQNNIGAAARKGDVSAVTQKINGGQNGLADRQAKYDAYSKEGRGQASGATVAQSDRQTVAPSTGVYERAQSQSPDATVTVASAPAPTTGPGGAGGGRTVTAANDVPMVLGDNNMVVINSGMLGA